MKNEAFLILLRQASFSCPGNGPFRVCFQPRRRHSCNDNEVTSTADKGEVNKAVLGLHPSGVVTYTADGRMPAIIPDGRRPLSVADRVSAPAEERAQAYSAFMAYAGRYTDTG
jgi:hypothetical protein